MKSLYVPDTAGLDAALLMFRQNPEYKSSSFLFVEGESDEKFWLSRISEQQCCIVFLVAFSQNNQRQTGKTAVIKNIRSLNQRKIDGFLGIIDNDFDGLNCLPRENNLYATDTYDLESLLLRSPQVFKKLLAEYGDSDLISKFQKEIGLSIQEYLLQLALPFAQIEWLKQNLNPSLEIRESHKNNTILIPEQWILNRNQLNSVVKSKGIDLNLPECQRLLAQISNVNPWVLCNGHTLVDILSIGFQKGALGNHHRATSENISSYIRGAIERDEFYQTELCQAISIWQNNHLPYQVLA